MKRFAISRSVAALESTKPQVRLRAVERLANSRDKEAFNPCISALSDPCPEIRACAARAVANIADINGIKPLVDAALREKEGHVWRQITDALTRFDADLAIKELLPALDHADAKHRQAAASTLRKQYWTELTNAQQSEVMVIQGEWEAAAKVGNDAIDALIRELLRGTLHAQRRAAYALGTIGTLRSCEALHHVLQDKTAPSSSKECASSTLKSLTWNPLKEERTPRINKPVESIADSAASRSGPSQLRRAQLKTTVKSGPIGIPNKTPNDGSVANCATLQNQTEDPLRRIQAAKTLARLGGKDAECTLVRALSDEAWSIRVAAANALQELDCPLPDEKTRALAAINRLDWEVVSSLGRAAMRPLLDSLKFGVVAEPVVDALAEIRPEGVDALRRIANDNAFGLNIREHAAIALARESSEFAMEPLLGMLKDPDIAVRVSAVLALENTDWSPQSPEEQVMFAIAHGHWDELPRMGGVAVEPLLRMIESHLAVSDAVETLALILEKRPLSLTLSQLQKLMRWANEWSDTDSSSSGWSSLAVMAKSELGKRGVFMK